MTRGLRLTLLARMAVSLMARVASAHAAVTPSQVPAIGVNEFMEFGFNGKTPKDAVKLAWKVDQTYKDGTVVS